MLCLIFFNPRYIVACMLRTVTIYRVYRYGLLIRGWCCTSPSERLEHAISFDSPRCIESNGDRCRCQTSYRIGAHKKRAHGSWYGNVQVSILITRQFSKASDNWYYKIFPFTSGDSYTFYLFSNALPASGIVHQLKAPGPKRFGGISFRVSEWSCIERKEIRKWSQLSVVRYAPNIFQNKPMATSYGCSRVIHTSRRSSTLFELLSVVRYAPDIFLKLLPPFLFIRSRQIETEGVLVKLNTLGHTCYDSMYTFTDQGTCNRKICMFLVNKAIPKTKQR